MAKKIKMVLYGEPGTGKSVFACKAPKPFFICTDGNYDWLEDFGADMSAHADAHSWDEIKKILNDKARLDKYETIVVDLLEDGFKWCESEFCTRNRIEHLSDLGYGKGYDITRNDFFIDIGKLLSIDKNVILIMHGMDVVRKDRRGVEHTYHVPSPRIPDKLLDNIEGRVRYFLRCYVKGEEQADGTFVKKRYLSLIPKENEFGICRGVDENKVPHDIPLDWNEFAKAIGFTNEPKTTTATEPTTKPSVDEIKDEPATKVELPRKRKVRTPEPAPVETVAEKVEDEPPFDIPSTDEINAKLKEVVVKYSEPKTEEKAEPEVKTEAKPLSRAEQIAALKAKIEAQKNKH